MHPQARRGSRRIHRHRQPACGGAQAARSWACVAQAHSEPHFTDSARTHALPTVATKLGGVARVHDRQASESCGRHFSMSPHRHARATHRTPRVGHAPDPAPAERLDCQLRAGCLAHSASGCTGRVDRKTRRASVQGLHLSEGWGARLPRCHMLRPDKRHAGLAPLAYSAPGAAMWRLHATCTQQVSYKQLCADVQ